MAYAGVASLSHSIDLILNHHHNSISPKLKNQMISLQEHTIFLESFLEDSPQKVNYWEEEIIREGSDMAENIIELLLSDSLLNSKSSVGSSRSKSVKGKKKKHQLPYGFDELERVIDEIDSIVNRLKGINTDAMDGPDEELTKIISLLWGGSSELLKIGIYGREGMGKTTLARNAYNIPLIVEHFDVRAWSTVSEGYTVLQIASDLLRSMEVEVSMSNSEDKLITSLRENLDGRRYLIVLDDVRSFEILRWLRKKLPDNGNGSRIMLTTASYRFVKSVHHFHKMGFVDEDKIWNRLREEIFGGDRCPPQLEAIGKMIMRKCKGNYLATEVVSGILAAADRTEAVWEDILENVNMAFEDDYSTTNSKVLSLSYTYLPHHLRPCFLYLAIFPAYHKIYVSKLVKLWVAEGFLDESECKSFEETGEEHVEDLVRRNLVWARNRKSNNRIKSIEIHYPMREFCLKQARVDNFFLHVSRLGSFDQQPVAMENQWWRRVSTCIYDDAFLEGVYGSTVRTKMLFLDDSELGIITWSIGNVRLLRVLDLSNAYKYDLPEEVFELFHLRYLAFHSGFSVSEAISNLENLQTLIICQRENDGAMFGKLPEGVWRMPQLRHVIVFPFELPSPKGVTMSALENLQTLSRVVDFICSRENLEMIPNLKKLALHYTKNLRDVDEEYEPHNLIYMKKLEILKIEMDRSFEEEHKIINFAFPPSLKKLDLCSVQLPWEDLKIVASLPNLEKLKLRKHACVGETWETSERGFSRLTYLMIDGSNLESWITESRHFPRLKYLVLSCCLHLLEIPSDMGNIPTLESIELDERNLSLLASAEQIQLHRNSLGYNPLYIRFVKDHS